MFRLQIQAPRAISLHPIPWLRRMATLETSTILRGRPGPTITQRKISVEIRSKLLSQLTYLLRCIALAIAEESYNARIGHSIRSRSKPYWVKNSQHSITARLELAVAKDNKTGTFVAFIVGIGIGAAVALLLAPQAGDELRDDITEAFGDRVDQLRHQSKDLGRRSQKVIETAKEQVQDALKEGADAFTQAKKAGA